MRLCERIKSFEDCSQRQRTFGAMKEKRSFRGLDQLRLPRLEDARSARVFGLARRLT